MKTLLSTREVSVLLNLTETTIKRYAESGRLPCIKTLGGHRKFVLKEVITFAEQHSYPLTGVLPPQMNSGDQELLAFSVQTQNYSKISEFILSAALHNERPHLYELLIYLLKHHISIATIADEIIRPAMAKVGELWADDRLEVNQEHLASNALLEAIVNVRTDIHQKPPNGLSAVCACAEGDYHDIGLRLLSYALEAEGWSVQYLGASTPFSTLHSYINGKKPDLVCLSHTLPQQKRRFMENMRAIGDAAHSIGAIFVVGGFVARNFGEKDVHCDHFSASAGDVIAYLKDTFQLRPGPKKKKALVGEVA